MGKGTNLKRRYLAAAFSFAVLTVLMLMLAGNADAVLSAERGAATLDPLKLLSRALASKRCLYLWLLLDGLSLLFIYWALFGKSYLDYQSKMYEVVPGFEIPMPEGQGQHGTAWWLPEKKYGEAFASVDISAGVELPEELEEFYEAERGRADAVELTKS